MTDTTTGILPGVTVEAASPVLISGSAIAVTDGSGRYTVANLRPGTYTVTFTLQGFNKLIREGIVLTGDTAMQVNAQMQVGALEQSITVTGESPLVDVQTVREQFVVNREMMDALPGTTTFAGRALLIPGVRNTGMTEGQYWPAAHGNTWRDAQTMNDGVRANVLIDDGQWQMGWEMNQAATAELAYDAGGAPAEVQTGGVLQNAIPKEGGNTFRGTFFSQFGHENLNASNQTPELQAVLGELNRNAYNYNLNPGFGGPIVKDRLWFYTAFLRRDTKGWVAGSKFTGEGTPEAAGEERFSRGRHAGLQPGLREQRTPSTQPPDDRQTPVADRLRTSEQHPAAFGCDQVASARKLESHPAADGLPRPGALDVHDDQPAPGRGGLRAAVQQVAARAVRVERKEELLQRSCHRRGDGSVLDHRQSAGNPADVQRVRFLRDRVAQHQGRDAEPLGRLHPIQRSAPGRHAHSLHDLAASPPAWLSCPRRLTASRPRSTTTSASSRRIPGPSIG